MIITQNGVGWFIGGELNYKLDKLPTAEQVRKLLIILNNCAKECEKIING